MNGGGPTQSKGLASLHAPAPLRDLPIFLCWRYEARYESDPKPPKVPWYPRNNKRVGKQGTGEDRAKLTTFAVARDQAAKRNMTGVGMALLDGYDLVALDVDNCVVNGTIPDEVLQAIRSTYAEYSPSGNGIRAIFRGNLGNRKSHATPDQYGLEVFSTNGYVTLTGDMLPHVDLLGLENTVGKVTPELEALCEKRFGQRHDNTVTDDFTLGHAQPLGMDAEAMQALLERIDPDMGRDDWIRVGAALHHETEGGEDGFDLWHDWSSQGSKFVDEEDLRRNWDSFDRRAGTRQQQVTMATVKYLAKESAGQAVRDPISAEQASAQAESLIATLPPQDPQPLVRPLSAAAPYPIHALGPLREVVEAVQGMTQAPVAIPAQSALAVAALALQGFANVETLGGWRPLSLYCLTIAASGERKSSCDAPVMQAVKGFEREQAQAYADERKAWEIDQAVWKAKHDKVLVEIKKGTADRRELAVLGPEPAPPALPDRLVSEPTYEGLTKLFHLGQPSLGLFSDEGGQFLGGFAMSTDNRQKTLAAFNSLWMGDPIKRTRQGDGAFTLYGRRLSLHLMVQPVVAYDLLADPLAGDSGFLPRCLICEPASTIGTRLHSASKLNSQPIEAFASRLREILSTAMAMDPETRELKPRDLPLTPEARALLVAFSDLVELAQGPGGEFELVRGFASKAAELAARLAGVLELWRDLGAQSISAERMGWGIELARYYLREALRLAGAATVSASIAKAEALREWMLSPSWGKSWLTVREVMHRGPNRLREILEAKKAVQLLVEHGWLVPLPPGTIIDGRARHKAWRIIRE